MIAQYHRKRTSVRLPPTSTPHVAMKLSIRRLSDIWLQRK